MLNSSEQRWILVCLIVVTGKIQSLQGSHQHSQPARIAHKRNLPENCGQNSYSPAVKRNNNNKTVVPRSNFPSFVDIEIFNDVHNSSGLAFRDSHCFGAIISEELVLTAAQCLTELNNLTSKINVYVSDVFNEFERYHHKEPNIHYVKRYCRSPNFLKDSSVRGTTGTASDFAILELNSKFDFNNSTQPVCLPTSGLKLKENLTIVGRRKNYSWQPFKYITVALDSCGTINYPVYMAETVLCLQPASSGNLCAGEAGAPVIYLDPKSNKQYLYGLATYTMGKICDNNNLEYIMGANLFNMGSNIMSLIENRETSENCVNLPEIN